MGPLLPNQDLIKSRISPYISDMPATQLRVINPAICNASMTITSDKYDRDSRKCHALHQRLACTHT